MQFTEEQIKRYSRNIVLQEVGGAGQKKLLGARVLVVGAGGLGSPAAFYLAAAGVGTLGINDFDELDVSNLQRQILYRTNTVGRPKAELARETLQSLNPDVQVIEHPDRLASDNVMDIISGYDVVLDATDNFPTRYLTNDACVLAGKPSVHGSVLRLEGQATVFDASSGPCYRCLYPEPPPPGAVPTTQEVGVLGAVPGVVGTIQAIEAIKLILGIGNPLIGRLLLFDALKMSFREVRLRKDPACPLCGESPTITEPVDYDEFRGL